ncbi:hypothetical protein D3C75_1113890 [compost metagenome]
MAFFDGLLRKYVFLSEVKEKTFSKMFLYEALGMLFSQKERIILYALSIMRVFDESYKESSCFGAGSSGFRSKEIVRIA